MSELPSDDTENADGQPPEGESGPNEQQDRLIQSTEGTYLVDAGAGTGKTYTVTRRYANIIEQDGVEPEDVRLFTFTENAANEMRERIVRHCEYDMAALRDAPIGTFHGLCNRIIRTHGFRVPAHLGIDDTLASSADILGEEVVEAEQFRGFSRQFIDRHEEYEEFFQAVRDPVTLLELVRGLAAKGVFPKRDGWYRDGDRYLDGNADLFTEALTKTNAPRGGGSRQSDLRDALSGWSREPYTPDAPSESEIRRDGKTVDESIVWDAFEADRSELKQFVHDLYFEYIEFALSRNYITFWMQLLFAFVLLCEKPSLRETLRAEYVMIDEFQDTNELQFKVALLFAGRENLCVVGDWKQSIYGFQHAAVENILQFEDRLGQYIAELNSDGDRVPFGLPEITEIKLTQNYRSTQPILDFSKQSLTVPATGSDEVRREDLPGEITSLSATGEHELPTRIEAFQGETDDGGVKALLTKIQHIVDNPDYAIPNEDGEPGISRTPNHSDIAVLTRTRRFGRDLQTTATEHEVPVAYEGGMELFETDQAKLVLAWLRIADNTQTDRGWAVVLERAGYTLPEARYILEQDAYPDDMLTFREQLRELSDVGPLARRVLDRYGFTGGYADAVVHTLQNVLDSSTLTRGDLVRFVEQSWEAETTVEVEDRTGRDSVTVQTIHAAKGLEYPIVIVANMNAGAFPPRGGSAGRIRYSDELGIRQTHVATDAYGSPHVLPNWRQDVVSAAVPTEYHEERRLLYVATTRAEQHLLFSAGEDPCTFFEELDCPATTIDSDISGEGREEERLPPFKPAIATGTTPRRLSAHDLMEDIEGAGEEGLGMEHGQRVHDFAEAHAEADGREPSSEDESRVMAFLDGLEGTLVPEENAHLPIETDHGRVLIAGIIDLIHLSDDAVEVIDYKTDRSRNGEPEYRKQLSVYYHVLRSVYPDRTVSISIYYTAEGELVHLEPLSRSELRRLAEKAIEE